jgi:hypothetical protein
MRFPLRVIVAFATLLFAVPSTLLFAQAAQETKPCDAKPDWILQLRKPDEGWDTSFVDRAHKPVRVGLARSGGSELAGVVRTEYAARKKYFTWTEVVVDPCDHSARLRTRHLLIEQVYGYSRNRKTFAYGVYGNCGDLENGRWISASCDTGALLVDTTGNGKFDLLHFGVWAPSTVPDWVGN